MPRHSGAPADLVERDNGRAMLCADRDCRPLLAREGRALAVAEAADERGLVVALCTVHAPLWGGLRLEPGEYARAARPW